MPLTYNKFMYKCERLWLIDIGKGKGIFPVLPWTGVSCLIICLV